MPTITEVTNEQISRLNQHQLAKLLETLLYLEARANGIPMSGVKVPLCIYVPDDGEDGRIEWNNGPDKTDWIPCRLTQFQVKTSRLIPSKVEKELIDSDSGSIKQLIDDVLRQGGSYILFCDQQYNVRLAKDLINKYKDIMRKNKAIYADSANIYLYDSAQISIWVNEYLPAVVKVHRWLGDPLPENFEVWSGWSHFQEYENQYEDSDQKREAHIQQLRNHFSSPKAIARIVGMSGLGKSRLALEVFRPPKQSNVVLEQRTLSDMVVYIDAAHGLRNLIPCIQSWRSQQMRGIIVVDNCEYERHCALRSQIRHSENTSLSLLTIGFDPEDHIPAGEHMIRLDRVDDSVIRGILSKSHPALPKHITDFIVIKLADGFPMMAVLLAKAKTKNVDDITKIIESEITERLIWGLEKPDHEAQSVLEACSVFQKVGFIDKLKGQREFIALNMCTPPMDPERFHQIATNFINKGTLGFQGRYVFVRPKPLSIRLAADWWLGCSPEKVDSFISSIPPEMLDSLCEQFRYLNTIPAMQEHVARLCGSTAPFGQAEILNSDTGSRIFRAFAEVNPEASTDALYRVFTRMDREQILNVTGSARRNIIYALETLCFPDKTFPKAARVLVAFAAAENETWSNNATGIFTSLFRISLPGTKATPEMRLHIIDEMLESESDIILKLAVNALSNAFETFPPFRVSGPEQRGSSPPEQEWTPQTWDDVFNYWHNCWDRLISLATKDNEISILACNEMIKSVRTLAEHRRFDDLENAVSVLAEKNSDIRHDAVKAIRDAYKYEGSSLPENLKEKLISFESMFVRNDLSDKLTLLLRKSLFDFKEDPSGKYYDRGAVRAQQFAEECIKCMTDLVNNLPLILQGQQDYGFAFGFRLGELADNPKDFVKQALSVLEQIPPDKANPNVIIGFLSALQARDPQIIDEILDQVSSSDKLSRFYIDFRSTVGFDKSSLEIVIRLLHDGNLDLSKVQALQYGSLLKSLPIVVIDDFCNSLSSFGIEGTWLAIDFLFLYTHEDQEKFAALKQTIRKLLLMPDILINHQHATSLGIITYRDSAIGLLKAEDPELALHLSKEIVKACATDNYSHSFEKDIKAILTVLLKMYRLICWPTFSEALLERYSIRSIRLQNCFKVNPAHKDEPCLLLELPLDFIMNWCKANKETAPKIVANITTIYSQTENGNWSFHPLIIKIIDEYGGDIKVLNELSANMGTYSSIGSLVPYYHRQLETLKQIQSHGNKNVRNWVNDKIAQTEEKIKKEKYEDEEESWSI